MPRSGLTYTHWLTIVSPVPRLIRLMSVTSTQWVDHTMNGNVSLPTCASCTRLCFLRAYVGNTSVQEVGCTRGIYEMTVNVINACVGLTYTHCLILDTRQECALPTVMG